MDINQLKYFVAVVESDYNITKAANKLYLSQPALSKSLGSLEEEMKFPLFLRASGRLSALSANGALVYDRAKDIVAQYDSLIELIEYRAKRIKGSLLLGIPPLVITALFSDFFNQLHETAKDIAIDILEFGAAKLEEMMSDQKLDYAVLLSPTNLDKGIFSEFTIHYGELTAYMSTDHPYADRPFLTWADFTDQRISLCDETYKTYHLVVNRLTEENIQVHSIATSYSWDYSFYSIRNTNKITILPYLSKNLFKMEGMVEKHIQDPIPWHIVLAYRKREKYSRVERYLYEFCSKFFDPQTNLAHKELIQIDNKSSAE